MMVFRVCAINWCADEKSEILIGLDSFSSQDMSVVKT